MTTTPQQTSEVERRQRFTAAINRHGYAFQNAIIKYTGELYDQRKSPWIFEASEFPVNVGGHNTRIDFILSTPFAPCWLLAECKRVNPDYSDWCFWRSEYVRHGNTGDTYIAEVVEEFVSGGMHVKYTTQPMYHQGLSVRPDGEKKKLTDDAIENAASQLCLGLNGMVKYLHENKDMLGSNKNRILLPVIFTTAKLWVCDTPLHEANMQSGDIDPESSKFTEVKSLLYQYHVSRGIKHDIKRREMPSLLSAALAIESIRTIGIVTPDGIADFLASINPQTLRQDKILGA